ncbi:endolytic transglycosylase MltG [Alkalilacustris brevis]|uniref:endolytic transglycosylase MltG n=1 Tax=Alkalilacustris brevis TaxID=2026338 RepID=UPI000E0CDA31|nr:endolytic transglycosylase MltG [Alkalilacustris brevis]
MARHIAANVLTLVIAGLLVVAGIIAWGQREFTSEGPLEQAICLRVERGASLPAVARQLEEEGAISHARVFRVGANYTGRAEALRFGSYLVPPGASMEEILDILTRGGASTCGTEVNFRIGVTRADTQLREVDPESGRFVEVLAFPYDVEEVPEEYAERTAEEDARFRVTLAEGVTSWQVVEALRAAPFLSGEIADIPAEGSLAPDSYEVVRGAERAALIERMQARQAAILEELWEARAEDLPITTPEEALILASIIEKETSVSDERRQVASVFVNRLRVPMRLQTDPTVIYGVTEGRGTLGRGLRRSELDTPTPYNTYQIDGLPPTPIANPGRASIAAALDPDDTPYLYFVADGTGGHTFSTNLADHNRAVARWRQIEAERNAPQE